LEFRITFFSSRYDAARGGSFKEEKEKNIYIFIFGKRAKKKEWSGVDVKRKKNNNNSKKNVKAFMYLKRQS
jgi:lipopolysaccharide export LptBFGC system permease protein LptF